VLVKVVAVCPCQLLKLSVAAASEPYRDVLPTVLHLQELLLLVRHCLSSDPNSSQRGCRRAQP
jgi:hypothetical protein